jgi:hypothetical protein
MHHRLNRSRGALPVSLQFPCQLFSMTQNENSSPERMRLGMTGSQRKAENLEKFMDSISVPPTSELVPPTLMPPQCVSRMVGFTWATILITSLMGARVALFCQPW